jgi:hypothetical protein
MKEPKERVIFENMALSENGVYPNIPQQKCNIVLIKSFKEEHDNKPLDF